MNISKTKKLELKQRNKLIYAKHLNGEKILCLARAWKLSERHVKRIIKGEKANMSPYQVKDIATQ